MSSPSASAGVRPPARAAVHARGAHARQDRGGVADGAQPLGGLARDVAQHVEDGAARVRLLGGAERAHLREQRIHLIVLGDRRGQHERADAAVELCAAALAPVPQGALHDDGREHPEHDAGGHEQDRLHQAVGEPGHPSAAVMRASRARGLNGFVT